MLIKRRRYTMLADEIKGEELTKFLRLWTIS